MADEEFGEFAPDDGPVEEAAEVAPGFIDLPFESGSADPQPLQYAEIGKPYVEGEDFKEAQKRSGQIPESKGGDEPTT